MLSSLCNKIKKKNQGIQFHTPTASLRKKTPTTSANENKTQFINKNKYPLPPSPPWPNPFQKKKEAVNQLFFQTYNENKTQFKDKNTPPPRQKKRKKEKKAEVQLFSETYKPLVEHQNYPRGGPGPCQAHEVFAANVTREHRCPDLQKRLVSLQTIGKDAHQLQSHR